MLGVIVKMAVKTETSKNNFFQMCFVRTRKYQTEEKQLRGLAAAILH